MSFNFLLPTLTFVNIGPQVTLDRLKFWWPAAVNIIVRWDPSPAKAVFPSPQSHSKLLACADGDTSCEQLACSGEYCML